MKDACDRHIEIHGAIFYLFEYLYDELDKITDRDLRIKIVAGVERIHELVREAEYVAMGEEWTRYFLGENEVKPAEIEEIVSRVFEGIENKNIGLPDGR